MKEKFLRNVFEKGFCVLEQFVDKQTIELAGAEYLSIMKNQKLHSQREKFSRDDLEKTAWRKSAIGSGNGLGDPISQVLQTTYFRETNPNVVNLTAAANSAILIRNSIDGRNEYYE